MWSFKKKDVVPMFNEQEVEQLISNAIGSIDRSRIANIMSGGDDRADTLHCIYADFGYPESLEFSHFWNMYRRFGMAAQVINAYPNTCWITPPEIQGSNQFNRDLQVLVDKMNLWQRLKGLDTRQRVGRYAGMFMRVRDGLKPDQPIAKKLAGLGGLVRMVPLYESQLAVLDTDENPESENYGLPTMYEFNSSVAGNRTQVKDSFNIHPSRIVIGAEGADDGGIYGIPAIESSYNSLMDIRKILGSGGEGFWKNAAQSVIFELKDGSTATANKGLLEKFNKNYDDWSRSRARKGLWTPGLTPKVLQSNLVDPANFFLNSLYDISASSNIPASILIGNQTGILAGNQDTLQYKTSAQSRRERFLGEMTGNVLDWFINWGILPASEYTIEWDDLREQSDKDKLELSEKMAKINSDQFRSGGDIPFAGSEIREQGGYGEEDLPEAIETEPDD